VRPYRDNAPGKSFRNCACRRCHQLFRGQVWKCPPIAYLRLQKEKYPDLSPQWDEYLQYEPLSPDASQWEALRFFAVRAEKICAMCPSNPAPFQKPSPLSPLAEVHRTL
jgi:hypothetical protein